MLRQAAIILIFIISFHIAPFAEQINVPGEYATIQAGIDASSDGDTILLAPGAYTGPGNNEIALGGKDVLVTGSEEPEATVLDGGGSGAVFRMEYSGEDSNTIVAKMTITNATWGIFISGASPALYDLIVSSCSTGVGSLSAEGGGIFPVIERSRFITNGIGLALSNGSKARIDSCVFDSNRTAVLIDFASGIMENSSFVNNIIGISANYDIYMDTNLVMFSTFDNNGTAVSGSVRIRNSNVTGGATGIVLPIFSQAAVVESCLFEGVADTVFRTGMPPSAQVARLEDENPGFTLRHSIIRNCGAVARVTAPYEDVGQFMSFSDCIVTGNTGGIEVTGDDVRLFVSRTLYAENAGPIHFQAFDFGTLIIDHATIARNSGDGISIGANSRPVTIKNSIMALNVGAGIRIEAGSQGDTILYNDCYGNIGGNYVGTTDPTGINGNISSDPLFRGGEPYSYRLAQGSPAIDSGDPLETDPDGSRTDMGAYIFSTNNPPEPFPIYAPLYGARQVAYYTAFIWGGSFDIDPLSNFTYRLELSEDSLFDGEKRVFSELYDTSLAVPTDSLASVGSMVFWRVVAVDNDSMIRIGGRPEGGRFLNILPPGDANGNGTANAFDVIFLVNYFKGIGPAPDPLLLGDANANCNVNGLDVVYLVNYFKGSGQPIRRGICQPGLATDDSPQYR